MANDLPLADVKILDFMWVIAGPAATRLLADYGATVVRIESTSRLDTSRTIGPFVDGVPGAENSALFQNMNAGKLGLTLDVTHEAGKAVILDLVRWADVVTEAFSPGAMHAWGLDYASLRQIKPDIIMLSTSLMGQTGPLSRFAGFGNLAAAISGFFGVTGWPHRPPAGPFSAYTDYVAPRFTAAAILAALDYRRRTGTGQYIDQSQAESALHFLAPALLDYTANRRVQGQVGNRDPNMAPHGVYAAAGDDRWVAIAVTNPAQWEAFCAAIERPELATDDRFTTTQDRLANQEALDDIVAAWTREREAPEIEAILQARGIPASVVQGMYDLASDPQLAHREHFVPLEHPIHGTVTVEGSRFKLSRTPARVDRAAPTLGRDNRDVLEAILGYGPERIAELEELGVLH
jgi:crotonobetainyl-CoA:carnitine CoA-transferase CaiB-like acyl-CoA transferase